MRFIDKVLTPFPTLVPKWFLHTTQNLKMILFQFLTLQDFFSSHGLSLSHVKLMAGLGLMTTCLGLTMFLLYLCSRRLRGTQASQGRR